ncbi:MAG: hypothetical protein HQK67_09500, partial [Desulfamplus sp.]|nr:hypothetical protein [Desulfamplus sp.]
SDKVKDLRGFAIKIMGVKGERFQTQDEEKEMRDEEKETRYQDKETLNQEKETRYQDKETLGEEQETLSEEQETQGEEKETQDFILLSYPVMPLGTVKLFHDAVYYSIKWSPFVFISRLVLSGNFHIINELRKARQNQTSPLDIRYWSTTPYMYGKDHIVKYSIIPTSHIKSSLPSILADDYLTANMEKHLAENEASFDFMIQLQKDPVKMPVEDAGVEWSEKESPFIKVASIRIHPQPFRTKEREDFAEDLSFSPAHSLIEHRPIGGINRARVQIYRYLSEFRHRRNNRQMMEPVR